MRPYRAILFDCNGIIADDEPIHLRLFQKVLKEEGIALTRKEYFEKYLAMDDRSCFRDVLKSYHLPVSGKRLKELIQRKSRYYRKAIKKELKVFPGVRSFVMTHKKSFGMAVVSGALRQEINWILKETGLRSAFSVIVSTEDVRNGKPDPECYLKALKHLNKLSAFRRNPLKARDCIAVEDSIHGVQSAKSAGMSALAVTNSYSRRQLFEADMIVKSLKGVKFSKQ